MDEIREKICVVDAYRKADLSSNLWNVIETELDHIPENLRFKSIYDKVRGLFSKR